MYEFGKVRGNEGDNIYENPFFKRGNKANLKKIQRKTVNGDSSPGE